MEPILLYIALAIVVVMVCRAIFCWYFKINAVLEVLKDIRELLRKP